MRVYVYLIVLQLIVMAAIVAFALVGAEDALAPLREALSP